MPAYSFLDVMASISGPGGTFPLATGAAPAEEGIVVTMTESKNTMIIGADGSGMHTLNAGNAAGVTVTLLKTSPVNAQLMAKYDMQRTIGSAAWGKDIITINNRASGDNITSQQVAFRKAPDQRNAKAAGTMVWEFDAIQTDMLLGTYAETFNG